MGAIAEFFIHLHLNKCGYQQECLFKNIEASKAIKKGFDGYYSKNGEGWMMESKSGKITTHNISHKDKVEEAFNDLSDKIGGGGNNNPWENAYHHACLAKTNADILKNIKDLSDKYTREIFSEIKDYNIIPGSTIFLDNKLAVIPEVEDINFIERDISKWLKTKEYKKMHIVCVTKKTKDIFLGYLNS
ncbi:hypothetical protein KAR91_68040 [Candidatus Pacearchaeota archaeon]|nr:hypothetical protein [Candidatus Pacearchaeota archaeon]